jgi:hypothetical protein
MAVALFFDEVDSIKNRPNFEKLAIAESVKTKEMVHYSKEDDKANNYSKGKKNVNILE